MKNENGMRLTMVITQRLIYFCNLNPLQFIVDELNLMLQLKFLSQLKTR